VGDFASTDIVPRLRSDLVLNDTAHGVGENVVVVTLPQSGRQLSLRGFELSIARMLDGVRSAGDVVEKAASIGLPVSLEGLSRFVAQLRVHGLLVDPTTPPAAAGTTWPQRREWPTEMRTAFQGALRDARANMLKEAKQHLDGLPGEAFDHKEVEELNAWIEERLTPDEGEVKTFHDVFSSVERSWFEEGANLTNFEDGDPEPTAAEVLHAERTDDERPRRRPWRLLVQMTLIVVVVVVAIIPWPTRAHGTFVLEPQASVVVTAATSGLVGGVDVHEGQWVAPGDVLFHYDTDTPKKKLAEIEARQTSMRQQLDQLNQAVAIPTQELADARAKLVAAQEELTVAQAAHHRHETADAQRHVWEAESKVRTADAALTSARAQTETAAGITHDALEAQLATASGEHDVQQALAELPAMKASAPGVVIALTLKAGDTVQAGTPVCRLDDTRKLGIVIHADDPATLHAPQWATATIDDRRIDVQVDKVDHSEGRGVIDNPDRKLQPGVSGEISIVVERRSLVARWFF
jgi:biotin carboxyl carrier protein